LRGKLLYCQQTELYKPQLATSINSLQFHKSKALESGFIGIRQQVQWIIKAERLRDTDFAFESSIQDARRLGRLLRSKCGGASNQRCNNSELHGSIVYDDGGYRKMQDGRRFLGRSLKQIFMVRHLKRGKISRENVISPNASTFDLICEI
jgi:hypothetical protein